MFTVLMVVQVLLGLSIIGLVLLQQGKGADMGAAFGAGASGTVFGARGSGSFFSRATAVLAFLFFANSIMLSSPLVLGDRQPAESVTSSVLSEPATDVPPADEAADVPASDLPDVDTGAAEATAADDLPAATDLPEATDDADVPAAEGDMPDAEAAPEAAADETVESADTPAAADEESGKSSE
jgi:preprotein translocase subunit SecG